MAQALTVAPGQSMSVSGTSPAHAQVVDHLYRVDPLQISHPHHHIHHFRPSRRRRTSFNSYHSTLSQHDYLTLQQSFTNLAPSQLLVHQQQQQQQQQNQQLQQRHHQRRNPRHSNPVSLTSRRATGLASPRSCVHSLSEMPMVESLQNEAFPNSPPDLTESKSSKSSGSFRSSCLTDATGQENLSHFEEIALADSGRNSVELYHVDKKILSRPPVQRSHSTSIYSRKNGVGSVDGLRDIANKRIIRPRYPGVKEPVRVALQEHQREGSVPIGLPMRRGLSSASATTIGTMSVSRREESSSRSPSPSGHASTRSYTSNTSAANSFLSQHRSYTRRSSMQPRKTVQELEAECHDSDEDVPEDAVIWNVPISPCPPFGPSQPPSPRLPPSATSHATLSPHLSSKHASSETTLSTVDVPRSPRSPMRPNMPRSATMASFPPALLSRKERTKSWTLDLSEEARELTAALEAHAEAERQNSRKPINPTSPLPSPGTPSRATFMELPPMQKGNVMIDPLPISKEKEAVLTRTRPSWLPPKSQKEERKHIREWEQMMARAAAAERAREQKQREEAREKIDAERSLARIWEEHVLPNWSVVVPDPRTRGLWWRGITPRSRGVIWAKAIGNELELTEASYTAALGRSKALRASIKDLSTEERLKHKDAAWLSAIARDVPTVLTELGIFGKGAPLHNTLMDVLHAYASYRSDVGYVYGTHLLAGFLVLNLPAPDAFITLANLMNRPMPLAFLVNDTAGIRRFQELVLSTLKYKIPKLHDHLTDPSTGVHLDEWLSPFMMMMGTMHLSPEACARVWDVAVFEGDKMFVRATVGVLSLLESKLYGGRGDILTLLGWGAEKWRFGEEEVVNAAREAGKVSNSSERK